MAKANQPQSTDEPFVISLGDLTLSLTDPHSTHPTLSVEGDVPWHVQSVGAYRPYFVVAGGTAKAEALEASLVDGFRAAVVAALNQN
jgi:hypothetical protein